MNTDEMIDKIADYGVSMFTPGCQVQSGAAFNEIKAAIRARDAAIKRFVELIESGKIALPKSPDELYLQLKAAIQ